MKQIITALALAAFTALPAQAQQPTALGQAQAAAASQSASGSVASSNNSIVFGAQPATTSTTSRTETTGDTTVRTAPSLGGLALGGGHPCAYAPYSGQISIIGGGIGGAGMTVDSACLLLIQAAAHGDIKAYNAAMYMIAARDADACRAMYVSGMISDCKDTKGRSLVKAEPTAVVSTRNAPAQMFSQCERRADGKISISYVRGADKALARAQCSAVLK